jgi:hypothetical protein
MGEMGQEVGQVGSLLNVGAEKLQFKRKRRTYRPGQETKG